MNYIAFFVLLAGVQAHTLFQKVSVNGVDQGDLFGVRVPDSNFVSSQHIATSIHILIVLNSPSLM